MPGRRTMFRLGVLLATALFCLSAMTSCSSPGEIPPYFDAIHRLPVRTVIVHGQRIAYLDIGEGEPVILIHGFGGSMWQWEYQQHTLSSRFRLITPDLLGSGLSDKPDIDYRPEQMLAFLTGFMDALGISRATLIGNSMGAGLAMGAALTAPARVDKLVLIAGLPAQVMTKLGSPTVKRALESQAPSWVVSLGNRLFGWLMVESIMKEMIHDPALLTPAVLERSERNRTRPGLMGPLMSARDNLPLWEKEYATRITEIRHPTLILWGAEDRVFPPSVGEELEHAIIGSRLVKIPNAGHIPQWEQPELSNQAMIQFLTH